VFDADLRGRLRRRIDDEAELRRAIAQGEIEPWYQPIVDLRTSTIVGAEALARWRHPTRGVLAAGAFIPIVEESGLVGALTDLVVERVVRDLTTWRESGTPIVRVKVNLGAEPFSRPNLAEWLSDLIRRHRCPTDAIGVEVTETSLLRDLALAAEHLRKLRETGLTVALDDFGTAWSSLALLRELPLDTVKIDRMFIRELTARPRDQALVGAVVGMARQLDLDVVAEGVETVEQAQLAASLGCDMAQGYLYAPAVAGPKLVEMLHARPFERLDPVAAAG
jgi:EAL domain-containing protein (putative c-di-GMP-specific phosphodiesterase class I)